MRREIVWLVVAGAVLSACSLQSGSPNTPESSPQPEIVAPSLTPPPSSTSVPASPTSTETVKLATATPCSLRTVWPVYTVASGDTLGKIAEQTGTDVASLVAANCLADKNLISVGQQ